MPPRISVGCTSVPPFSKSYPVSVHPDHYQFHWASGRVLQEYQALYVLRGDGEFESRTVGNKKVLPGSVMLLFPGEWHRYRPRRAIGWDDNISGLWWGLGVLALSLAGGLLVLSSRHQPAREGANQSGSAA